VYITTGGAELFVIFNKNERKKAPQYTKVYSEKQYVLKFFFEKGIKW